ncbi:MAG TPA: UpxY family transcription antiterminator [Pedobacter sp.]|jgi:transcription antitermination factor NusG
MTEKYQWYPVYTNPRAEKKANELLTAKGIETYLPLQKTFKQWSDRKKIVEEPFLKSYLFVRIMPSQHAEVLMTRGICRFIYFSGKIASMPERQIADLKLLFANEADIELTERTFKAGEAVRVSAGPLLGLRGELVTVLSQKKLLVRVQHINQSVLVQVPATFLESLEEGNIKMTLI